MKAQATYIITGTKGRIIAEFMSDIEPEILSMFLHVTKNRFNLATFRDYCEKVTGHDVKIKLIKH